ncbi:hypothetical protein [Streptomyces olivochromogenes]|uniref:hypothetical protein n=1 Tax=Streptomyces olivochromogenes TaxID=1963 RepID=UPI001F29ECC9|nr:hypothetical protein [Streptomyces olivochromogenes]
MKVADVEVMGGASRTGDEDLEEVAAEVALTVARGPDRHSRGAWASLAHLRELMFRRITEPVTALV